MAHAKDKLMKLSFVGVVVSLGIIYGDIGRFNHEELEVVIRPVKERGPP